MNDLKQARKPLTRRGALKRTGLMMGAAVAAGQMGTVPRSAGAESAEAKRATARGEGQWRYCLNTATIRGQKLGIVKEIEVTSAAGYQGIEPWVGTIQAYLNDGGTVKDLRKRLTDSGLTVECAIGFPAWIVDDDAQRAKGLEQAKREMELIASLGGKRIAAPPAGATKESGLDLLRAAERYRALIEVGAQFGIVPQVEVWGFSKNLSRLGECAFVAIESRHPKACILADIYHLFKGGSDPRSLRMLSGSAVEVLHINDYPAEPARELMNDSHRVFPGDGVGPVKEVLQILQAAGGPKVLSLELFNRTYWEQDPLDVARRGLAKMKAAVAEAMG